MKLIKEFQEFKIYTLSKNLAVTYADEIVKALDQIPQVDPHSKENILAETKGVRILHAKWEHSLIALAGSESFAGVIIGYERDREGNNQYPENCIYLSDLAVSENFQKRGLGKFLSQLWLEFNMNIGFLELKSRLIFCVQTNKAEWNNHVQKLYESLGFIKTGEKTYGNRVDNIYSLVV